MKRFLWLLVLFGFLASAYTTSISANPQYWTESVGELASLVMPRVDFGNSTAALTVQPTTGIATGCTTCGYRFFPYNSTGMNLSAGGRLVLNEYSFFSAPAGDCTPGSWIVTLREGACDGVTLATDSVLHPGDTAVTADFGGVVLSPNQEYCIQIEGCATGNGKNIYKDGGDTLGFGYYGDYSGGWTWYPGEAIKGNFNFSEWYPVRSPKFSTNTSSNEIDLATVRNDFDSLGSDWTCAVGSCTFSNGIVTMDSAGGTTYLYYSDDVYLPPSRLTIRANVTGVGARVGFDSADSACSDMFRTSAGNSLGVEAGHFTGGASATLGDAADYYNEFHDYTVEWTQSRTNFYIDGRQVASLTPSVPSPSGGCQTPIKIINENTTNKMQVDYAVLENELPSGAIVHLWANGSGKYDWLDESVYNFDGAPVYEGGYNYSLMTNAFSVENAVMYPEGGVLPVITSETGAVGEVIYKFDAPNGWEFEDFDTTADIRVYSYSAGQLTWSGFWWSSNGSDWVKIVNQTRSDGGGSNHSAVDTTISTGGTTSVFLKWSGWSEEARNRPQFMRGGVDSWLTFNGTMSNTSSLNLPVVTFPAANFSFEASSNSSANLTFADTYSGWQPNWALYNSTSWEGGMATFDYNSGSVPSWINSTPSLAGFVGGVSRANGVSFTVPNVTTPYNETQEAWFVADFSTVGGESFSVNRTNAGTLTVYSLNYSLMNCSFLSDTVALNYSIKFENNGSLVAANHEGSYEVRKPGETQKYYQSIEQSGDYYYGVCLYPAWADLWVDSQEQYGNGSLVTRSYYLNNASITNSTEYIDLHTATSGEGKLTQIFVQEASGQGADGLFVYVQRKNLGTGVFELASISKTDENGYATTYLIPNDAFYRVLIYDNTTLIKEFEPAILYCSPSASSCSWTLILTPAYYGILYDYADKIGYSCSEENSTVYWNLTCSVTDTSGLMQYASLEVWEQSPLSSALVCNETIYTSSGSLECSMADFNESFYSWKLVAKVNPSQVLNSGSRNWAEENQYGVDGVLVSLLLFLSISASGLFSPGVAVLLAVFSVIIAAGLGTLVVLPGVIGGLLLVGAIVYLQLNR